MYHRICRFLENGSQWAAGSEIVVEILCPGANGVNYFVCAYLSPQYICQTQPAWGCTNFGVTYYVRVRYPYPSEVLVHCCVGYGVRCCCVGYGTGLASVRPDSTSATATHPCRWAGQWGTEVAGSTNRQAISLAKEPGDLLLARPEYGYPGCHSIRSWATLYFGRLLHPTLQTDAPSLAQDYLECIYFLRSDIGSI
ncbi:hypothetical protein LY76DRAFT_631350 [Colletotrichum caudatum]|nr:hypothetical protein LY76DRAFT_631350 [Colletotrichum caudatum]